MLTNPRLDVRLYSHDFGPVDLSAAVVAGSTSKTTDGPGQWSISIKEDALRMNSRLVAWQGNRPRIMDDDWISIAVDGRCLMLGLVDGVRRSRSAAGHGSVDVSHTITGRDFAKAFVTSDLAHSPFFFRIDPRVPGTFSAHELIEAINAKIVGATKAPHELLLYLLQITLRDSDHPGSMWWRLPEGLSGGDSMPDLARAMHLSGNVPNGKVLIRDGYLPTGRVSLDSYLSDPLVTPLTEWFYDLRAPQAEYPQPLMPLVDPNAGDGYGTVSGKQEPTRPWGNFPEVPTLIYREFPFDSADWAKLPLHKLHRDSTISDDLGTSGAERFTAYSLDTHWWTNTRTAGLFQSSAGKMPIIEYDGNAGGGFGGMVERHGLRWLELHNKLAPQSWGGSDLSNMVEQTERIYRWYSDLPEYLSGSVNVPALLPEVRIGHRLRYDGREYYMQGVDHSFTVNDTSGAVVGDSALTVIRGHVPDDTIAPPRPWKSAAGFSFSLEGGE